jgi:hypothetical protein
MCPCCSLFLAGLVSNQQHLNELVLSLDEAYQTWYSKQVSPSSFGSLVLTRAGDVDLPLCC